MFRSIILRSLLSILVLTCTSPIQADQVVTTIAGGGWRPFPRNAIPAQSAPLGTLSNVVVDLQGNLYVSDSYNNIVVRIAPTGSLQLIAGNGNAAYSGDGGDATLASLNYPAGLALDTSGNLYIADFNNHRIRKVSRGIITTVAGTGIAGFNGDNGLAINAQLNQPRSVAVDSSGVLYIADQFNYRVRAVAQGIIRTVAGSGFCCNLGDGGPATNATLDMPQGVAVDSSGNLYIADGNVAFDNVGNRIRKVTAGIITTVSGNGNYGFSGDNAGAFSATLANPEAVAVDSLGAIYIADTENNRIRKIAGGSINTIAGNGNYGFSGDGGPASKASLDRPGGLAIDPSGQIYVADFWNERIRKISNGNISSIAGTGGGTLFGDGGASNSASLINPYDAVIDSAGNVYIADAGNHCVRKVSGGVITTVAGNGVAGFSGDNGPAVNASLSFPSRLALDSAGNLYISDNENHRVRKVSNGIITTVAGNGTPGFSGDGKSATSAQLNFPNGLAVDNSGNLYISDTGNNRIRKVSGGIISTVAGTGVDGFSGDGGPATGAAFSGPDGLALDASGNLYIADVYNSVIRKLSGGRVTTVVGYTTAGYSGDGGSAVAAQLYQPSGLAFDSAGNLFIADTINNVIRKVSPSGIITTVAGSGSANSFGDGGPALSAGFSNPSGIAVDSAGSLYIVDTFGYRIRRTLNTVPTYQVSPASLSFSASSGGAITASQTLVLSTGVPGLAFQTSTSASWITVTPTAGSLPASLQVTVDPSHLDGGSYQGTITISTPYATPPTTIVAVSADVQAAAPPQLSIATETLSFTSLVAAGPQTAQVQITNTGAGSLAFTAVPSTVSGGGWLSVSPANGAATPSSPASLTVTADPGSLAPGTYTGSIAIASGDMNANVSVTLSVSSPSTTLLLSQTGLSFSAAAQGGRPLSQTFGILNVGQGAMDWSAGAATLSGGSSWLSISPANGTVTQPFVDVSTVSVSVDPAGLAPGDYYGRIQVSSSSINSPQFLTVILTVVPAGRTPGPEVRPSAIVFAGTAGSSPPFQDVLIGNPKPQTDNYLSAFIGRGFSYRPANGSVQPNQPATLRVFPNFSQLAAGTINRGTITLQFADGTSRNISILTVVAPSGSASDRIGPRDNSQCNNLNLQLQSPAQNFTAVLGQPTTLTVRVVDSCGNIIANPKNASVTVSFSNHDKDLNLAIGGNGVWTGTWRPVNAAQGSVAITATAFNAQSSGLQSGLQVVSGTLGNGTTPIVTAGGVVHAASNVAGAPLAPGSLITIYGANLSNAAGLSNTLPLPQQQNGTRVLLGNLPPLPILYTSNGQINVQVPFNTPINTSYQLSVQRDNTISVPEQLVIAAAQPGIFTVNQQGTGQGVIFHSDGVTLADPDAPASAGETVVMYCTGLGAVDPPVPEGTPAPPSPLSNTVNPVTVTIGGQNAQVSFSGLTPGYPGLYQVNAVVPDGVSGDDVSVFVSVSGQTSPAVTMAVQ